jgi:hypothetical protein
MKIGSKLDTGSNSLKAPENAADGSCGQVVVFFYIQTQTRKKTDNIDSPTNPALVLTISHEPHYNKMMVFKATLIENSKNLATIFAGCCETLSFRLYPHSQFRTCRSFMQDGNPQKAEV